jgi:hypothetical protein
MTVDRREPEMKPATDESSIAAASISLGLPVSGDDVDG